MLEESLKNIEIELVNILEENKDISDERWWLDINTARILINKSIKNIEHE